VLDVVVRVVDVVVVVMDAAVFGGSGFEILSVGVHAPAYSWRWRFDTQKAALEKFYRVLRLESGLMLGRMTVVIGWAILLSLVTIWLRSNLSPLPHPELASFAATLIIIGFGTVFSSLFISAMSMKVNARTK